MQRAWVILMIVLGSVPSQGQPSLEAALDSANVVWQSGGNVAWTGQTTVTHDRVDAAQSGPISDSQESRLETTVTGPGTVAFWWKVSSEGDCDYLEFYVGGVLQSQISGGVNWQRVSFAVPAGTQTLRWRYAKDVGMSGGYDTAWVDEAVFVPDAGAPVLLVQPVSQTVVVGVDMTLRVGAGGGTPLSYQWFYNETNTISGATSATLMLSNVQPADGGVYSVTVNNGVGSVTSSNAVLTVATTGPVDTTLLLVDGAFSSPYEAALLNRSQPFQRFTDETFLNLAIDSANPATTLVVVDSTYYAQNLDSLVNYIRAGGRAILQYWYLTAGSPLAAAFNVTVVQTLYAPQPVYDWGGSSFFTGVDSPLNLVEIGFGVDGQRLEPVAGALSVAGYANLRTTNQAALVIGNSNRTIVNGIVLEEATPSAAAARVAQNEIEFLAGAPPATVAPFITSHPESHTIQAGEDVSFTVVASGTPPLDYQWYVDETRALAGATNASLTLTNVQLADGGIYRVIVSNRYGMATSSNAILTVTNATKVYTALLLVDGPIPSAFEAALINQGRPYQRFTESMPLWSALRSANPARTLVIIDSTAASHTFTELANFVSAGGRAILQYWGLTPGHSLAATFSVTVIQTLSTPQPVYDWGGSPLFTGVGSPLDLVESGFGVDGQKLQPAAGGQAVAGYVGASTVNQAALVIGNSNRTILNGFVLEDASAMAAAARFAQNEIDFLIGPPPATVAPFISDQPDSQTIPAGGGVTFSLAAGGTLPLDYQWYFDETNALAGATNATLTLTNVQLADGGIYRVTVGNPYGLVTSSNAVLTVSTNPQVNTTLLLVDGPAASAFETALINQGQPCQRFTQSDPFSSAVRIANPAYTLVIIDSTAASYAFTELVNFVQAGGRAILQYWGLKPGHTLAAAFDVTVVQTFTSPLPVYDWGGTPLFGGISSPLNLADVGPVIDGQKLQPTAQGHAVAGFLPSPTANQAAVVLGNFGRTMVNGFLLEGASSVDQAVRFAENQIRFLIESTAPTPPYVITQPEDRLVQQGSTVEFLVRAGGTWPLVYEWFLDQTNIIAGATNATLSLANVQSTQAGGYSVVVSNAYGAVTSRLATLTVFSKPVFTVQPKPHSALEGGTVMFTASARGTLPIGWRWRLGTATLTHFNGFITSTPTNSTLTLTNLQMTNAGDYTAVASNLVGSVASSRALLTVLTDFDRDGMADLWEVACGFQTNNPADATLDADNDRMCNRDEYLAGTDPRDPTSALRVKITAADPATNHGVQISFLAVSNRSYTAHWTETLYPSRWSRMSEVPEAPTNREVSVIDSPPPGTARRYYRLVIPGMP